MKSYDSDYYDGAYYRQRDTGIDPYLAYVLIQYVFPQGQNAKILDVGCGSGAYVKFARAVGYKAWGLIFPMMLPRYPARP